MLALIRRTRDRGMVSIPGCYTPTDCFAAGADLLKIVPVDSLGPSYLQAMQSVLPAGTGLVSTGGNDRRNLAEYLEADVGPGSVRYRPGRSRETLRATADAPVSIRQSACTL